jgi:hypothetical protein
MFGDIGSFYLYMSLKDCFAVVLAAFGILPGHKVGGISRWGQSYRPETQTTADCDIVPNTVLMYNSQMMVQVTCIPLFPPFQGFPMAEARQYSFNGTGPFVTKVIVTAFSTNGSTAEQGRNGIRHLIQGFGREFSGGAG